MDCKDCQNYKPAWTPPVARFKPNKPLPDGAVCVAARPGHVNDYYWLRNGRFAVVYNYFGIGRTRIETINPGGDIARDIRALGLPVWGFDLNRNGETAEEFWTDEECRRHALSDTHVVGNEVALPLYPFYPACAPRPVTLLRRYHGKRKDGVSVDGWIVKPVAASVAKPGQPCPACGQPVPEPTPPAPFKVGDWVRLGGRCDVAHIVDDVRYERGSRLCDGKWIVRAAGCWWPVRDCISLRPALPPLPGEVRYAVAAWRREFPERDTYNACFYDTAHFVYGLYPHEFKD